MIDHDKQKFEILIQVSQLNVYDSATPIALFIPRWNLDEKDSSSTRSHLVMNKATGVAETYTVSVSCFILIRISNFCLSYSTTDPDESIQRW